MTTTQDYLTLLPPEIQAHIVQHLDHPSDVLTCGQLNAAMQESVWHCRFSQQHVLRNIFQVPESFLKDSEGLDETALSSLMK